MTKPKPQFVAVDFDGTCVTHEYPNVGRDVGAASVLRELVAAGHKMILYTMRSHAHLQQALDWFRAHDVPLYSANSNPSQKTWTASPKIYAHLYIDDAALGCPLIVPETGERPYVDWKAVRRQLVRRGFLQPKTKNKNDCRTKLRTGA